MRLRGEKRAAEAPRSGEGAEEARRRSRGSEEKELALLCKSEESNAKRGERAESKAKQSKATCRGQEQSKRGERAVEEARRGGTPLSLLSEHSKQHACPHKTYAASTSRNLTGMKKKNLHIALSTLGRSTRHLVFSSCVQNPPHLHPRLDPQKRGAPGQRYWR